MNCKLLSTIVILAVSAKIFNEIPLISASESNKLLRQVCGASNTTENRIVGGRNATLNEFPWMAAILSSNLKTEIVCGGALINNKFVLTAAHCLKNGNTTKPVSTYIVRLGELDLKSKKDGATPVDFKVAKMIVHENYSTNNSANDIGLIKLNKEVQFTHSIRPICLPESFDAVNSSLDQKDLMVIGWGLMAYNGKSNSVLQKVTLNLIERSVCKKNFASLNKQITSKQICAGFITGGKDSCQGDSGGPLMTKDAKNIHSVIGIVSFGHLCAVAGYPGVYTKVISYMNWIKKNAEMK